MELEVKRSGCSTIVNFAGAVKYQNFSRDRIGRSFRKLVDPEDYQKKESRAILKWLFDLSQLNRTANRAKSSAGTLTNTNHDQSQGRGDDMVAVPVGNVICQPLTAL